MLCLSGLRVIGIDLYHASLGLSFAATITSLVVLAFGLAATAPAALAALGILLASKAFVDYSASGLEDPLTHLLLALGLLAAFGRSGGPAQVLRLALCASLAGLNRMDSLLFFLPLLGVALSRCGIARGVRPLLLGFLPLLLWEAFALFYYGFPFPNSAYAKLGTGIEGSVLLQHGTGYLWNSLRNDPVTLVAILAGLATALRRRDAVELAAAGGVLLYLVYVVRVGGDFMSGRFLTAPLFCSVALLARTRVRWPGAVLSAIAAAALAALGPHPPLTSGGDFGTPRELFGLPQAPGLAAHRDAAGVADERWFYYQTTGLLGGEGAGLLGGGARAAEHPWARTGREARERAPTLLVLGNIGLVGYYAGPQVAIIDTRALSDPLLARLPVSGDWRIGHFTRELPPGYRQSVASGRNLIQDPELAALYDSLVLVTRADLFAPGRFAEIWRLNTGSWSRRAHVDGPPERVP
jgi:arabinofuranosyltransferase